MKAAGSALRVHRLLQTQPIVSAAIASKELNLSPPTVTDALGHLEKFGIVHETTGRNYGRLYAYGSPAHVREKAALISFEIFRA